MIDRIIYILNRMVRTERLYLVFLAVILAASIFGAFGTYRAFSRPAQFEEVMTYKHRGEFDYLTHLDASYVYGDITFEDFTYEPPDYRPATPKYAVEFVDRIVMSFGYLFMPDRPVNSISGRVEIDADIDYREGEDEEVVLMPMTSLPNGSSIFFTLDMDTLLASARMQISANAYLTIETDTGPVFERYSQVFTIWVNDPIIEMDRDLVNTYQASFGGLNYDIDGAFDYTVYLKEDSPYEAKILKPPVNPTPDVNSLPSTKTLGPGDSIYSALFDRMDGSFTYRFESNGPVRYVTEEVEVNAILETEGAWSKEFVLVPRTTKTGNFTVDFTLTSENLTHFVDILKVIKEETGISFPYILKIKAEVQTTAQTDYGLISEQFDQTLSARLGDQVITWEGQMTGSDSGSLRTNNMLPNPVKVMGFRVSEARILYPVLTGVFLASLVTLLIYFRRFKPESLPSVEDELLRLRMKYKDTIIDVEELPQRITGDTVSVVNSLDELVKIADSLFKPVLHETQSEGHKYCVIDGAIRYTYNANYNEGV
ncbi:MAG: hypothetical protein JSW16_00035 [Dehalococcoidales bacterium]|nr:MAG: hypothetical protein JSW16_00035 [Dehalococcoidales bacterium]